MKRLAILTVALLAVASTQALAHESSREATRDRMADLLKRVGPDMGVQFNQAEANEFAFGGTINGGLSAADALEIVIMINTDDTIFFRVFPHHNGDYIGVLDVPDSGALMHRLLRDNANGFFHWGVDSDNDLFAGYTVTLESGFPVDAIEIVMASIRNLDDMVAQIADLLTGGGGGEPSKSGD